MELTSLSLLERVRDGADEEPWHRLASIYVPLLQRWLQQYELQPSDADDLVQDVLAVVARDVNTFKHSGRAGAFRSWLKTILIHRLRRYWRNRKYRPAVGGGTDFQLQLQQLEDPASSLSAEWNREHDRHLVLKMLELIQPHFEENSITAFRRTVLEEASPEQVALDLGMTKNAVIIAKCRVLKALRRESRGLLDQ